MILGQHFRLTCLPIRRNPIPYPSTIARATRMIVTISMLIILLVFIIYIISFLARYIIPIGITLVPRVSPIWLLVRPDHPYYYWRFGTLMATPTGCTFKRAGFYNTYYHWLFWYHSSIVLYYCSNYCTGFTSDHTLHDRC